MPFVGAKQGVSEADCGAAADPLPKLEAMGITPKNFLDLSLKFVHFDAFLVSLPENNHIIVCGPVRNK